MTEKAPKDLLAQVIEFINKKSEMKINDYHMYKEENCQTLASFAIHESMAFDVILWYLTDEDYRSKMNEIYEIK